MVPGDNPVMELEKLPVPLPSIVVSLAIVGFCEVLQQTPRTVTVAPPSSVIFPPLSAEFSVIELAEMVDTVGTVAAVVVKINSFP
ncbi:hypothetical protein ES705_42067 [subsurface metagenome]